MPTFRTKEELSRAKWAEKYQSVAGGELYTYEDASPFPIHEYFKIGLLGKDIKMLEVNAGAAAVEYFVADTLTDMKIQIGEDDDDTEEQEAREWMDEIEFDAILEAACRDLYGNGYCVAQPFRLEDGSITVNTVQPQTWYPDIPTFSHQPITSGRIISIFSEGETSLTWYAFVEEHLTGKLEYKLYQIEDPDKLEGKEISLGRLPQFNGLKKSVKTDLERLAIFQQTRRRKSGYVLGEGILKPVWHILQEVSEIQTQIRQERIKHFRSKLAAPSKSLARARKVLDETKEVNFKTIALMQAALGDATQEIFPFDGEGQIPQFIKWDIAHITAMSVEIDKLLSRGASIMGGPKSMFNIEESAGNVKVDTEKRKDRKYIRQIEQGQRAMSRLVVNCLATWYKWKTGNIAPYISVTFDSPFELSQHEKVKSLKEMNPDIKMISQKRAIKEAWPKLNPDERDELQKEIEEEEEAGREPPPNSLLNGVPNLDL